jgi:hypothetical protein
MTIDDPNYPNDPTKPGKGNDPDDDGGLDEDEDVNTPAGPE